VRKLVAFMMFAAMIPASARGGEWYEKITITGDVRYRAEWTKQQAKDEDTRDRIRARLRVVGKAAESWSAGVGLATGTDDPISSNQTLTGGFSKKGIMLDLAYVDYHLGVVAGLSVTAGKMRLPFKVPYQTELMWDNDLTPEGLTITYLGGVGTKAHVFLNGGVFDIKDTNPDETGEAWMVGGQAGLEMKPSERLGFTAGAGYYNYEGAVGRTGFYQANEFFGNSTKLWRGRRDIGGVSYYYYYRGYAWDFNIVEALGVLDVKVAGKGLLTLYGTYVDNIRADSLGTGWLAGAAARYGEDRGALKLYANYRRLEADAVIGAFTDSEFIGGGTDGKGWELGLAYGAAAGVDVGVTWFLGEKGIVPGASGSDYQRLQIDVQARF
jgi:hypothetical protein